MKLKHIPFQLQKLKGKEGRFDYEAPKFIYKRNVRSFDRKTNRILKDTPLIIGKRSIVSQKKQKGMKYPYTKPMIGWERIFVGRGRIIKKGPRKRNKSINLMKGKTIKPFKPKFTKWISTYNR